MSEPTDREDLEQLVTSPGWLRLMAFAKKQWGPEGYGVRVKQAIAHAIAQKDDIAHAVQRVDAANDEINRLLSWPQERIRELLAQEQVRKQQLDPPLSRRGSSL